MNNDILWIFIVVINVGGFFIQIERPVWAYYLQKWTTINVEISPGSEFSADGMSLAIFFIIFSSFASDNEFINLAFLSIVSIYTLFAIFKIINAIPVTPNPKRLIVKVLDAFTFRNIGKGGSQKFVVIKAESQELGVRILPAYQFNFESRPHPNSNISILVRKGSLGLIYRLSFDYT